MVDTLPLFILLRVVVPEGVNYVGVIDRDHFILPSEIHCLMFQIMKVAGHRIQMGVWQDLHPVFCLLGQQPVSQILSILVARQHLPKDSGLGDWRERIRKDAGEGGLLFFYDTLKHLNIIDIYL